MTTVLIPVTPPVTRCWTCSAEIFAEGLPVCPRHVAGEFGISYRQVLHWVGLGHLRPRPSRPNNLKSPLRWPPAEVEVLRRMARLVNAGVALEVAARFARTGWPSGEIAPGIRLAVTTP